MSNLLILFIVLNVVNVIIQTVKSICTIHCGKTVAAIVNAIAYGLYTVVVVYTVCELPLWQKVVVVGVANLIGVWIVKYCEEKAKKEKMWKIEFTVPKENALKVKGLLEYADVPHAYLVLGKFVLFNTYCDTKEESVEVKKIIEMFNAKYFVSENHSLL